MIIDDSPSNNFMFPPVNQAAGPNVMQTNNWRVCPMNLGSHAVEIVGVLIPFGFFGLVLAMVVVGSKEKQVKARYQAEVQKEFLSKFASGHELTEFLRTEGAE